jgi:hypothetical protein
MTTTNGKFNLNTGLSSPYTFVLYDICVIYTVTERVRFLVHRLVFMSYPGRALLSQILPTVCIYGFHMIAGINSDYFLEQH